MLKRGGKRRGNTLLNLREVPTSSLRIKRLQLTPFQRASPPACLRNPRGASSLCLPKWAPAGPQWLNLSGYRDRELPFPKLQLSSIHPGYSAAILPPKWRYGDSGRDVAGRHITAGCLQVVHRPCKASQTSSSTSDWNGACYSLGIKRSTRVVSGHFSLVSSGLAPSIG